MAAYLKYLAPIRRDEHAYLFIDCSIWFLSSWFTILLMWANVTDDEAQGEFSLAY